MLHTFGEIRSNRREWSRLPDWIITSESWFPGLRNIRYLRNIDGYHVFKELSRLFYGFGWVLISLPYVALVVTEPFALSYAEMSWSLFEFLKAYVVVWVVHGLTFDIFYHVVFIKPDHWYETVVKGLQTLIERGKE